MKNFNIKLDDDIVDELKRLAKREKITQAAWFRRAIRNEMKRLERKKK